MISLDLSKQPPGFQTGAAAWLATGLSRAGLTRFLRAAQQAAGYRGEIDVLLTDDRAMRKLNATYRGKHKPTDVLSFPAAPELAGLHAGDLAISLDTAARQAQAYGHTLRDEVRILLLHGILHLAGMDHETDNGEMAEREAQLRRALRLSTGLLARSHAATARATAKRKQQKATA